MYEGREFELVREIQACYPLSSVPDVRKQDLTGARGGCRVKTVCTAKKPEMQPRAADAGYAPCWNFYLRSFLLWKTFLQVQQQMCYVLWICSKMLTLSLLEGSRSGNPARNGVFGKPEVTGYRGSCTTCLCAGATGSSLPCPT